MNSSAKTAVPVTKLHPFEFRVFRLLKAETEGLAGHRVLIACSGGMDSVVLAKVLQKLGARLGFEVGLAHVHHGPSRKKKTREARMRAFCRVYELAAELGIRFHTLAAYSVVKGRPEINAKLDRARIANPLASEEELRKLRHQELGTIRQKEGYDFIAFAHHADDLLETRLIRLIRGTGPQGLEAMSVVSEKILRPFLTESRSELLAYARELKLKWVEDPTNKDNEPLRNWIRNDWLKRLEKKRPGGTASLGRSLELLSKALREEEGAGSLEECFLDAGRAISRPGYKRLGISERKRLLALYLRRIGARHFGASHIEELIKRLETAQKTLSFELLKLHWTINAEQIQARPSQGE